MSVNYSDLVLPNLPDGFRIMVAGNLGEAQDLESICECIKLLKDYKEVKWIFIGDGSRKKWLDDFINVCKKKSVQLVVLSDYGHVAEKLEALGIDKKLFDWVISAPELGGLKPAPQLLLQILEKMKVTPKQCLVIGDREDTDGQLAHSVGALFQLV
jgi:HAD superfamily hydrolase (TIGR01549 family)